MIAAARWAGMLTDDVILAAIKWNAWLHPRGKDGRFIETNSIVNIFQNIEDALTDRSAVRRRGRISKLTPRGAHIAYFGSDGHEIPADPDKGFPQIIPLNDFRSKVSLAPKHIARLELDSAPRSANEEWDTYKAGFAKTSADSDPTWHDSAGIEEWKVLAGIFNDKLRASPPKGKSHNESGEALGLDSPEWAEHREYVDDVVDRALVAGLGADYLLKDGDGNWNDEAWTYFFKMVNSEIEKVKARGVPKDRKAVLLGGLPGAGKSTVSERVGNLGDTSKWVIVNPDLFKERIIADGMAPEITGLSPMETSSLMHALSSEMSHMFGQAMMAKGYNVILDTTMGGRARVQSSRGAITTSQADVNRLRDHGYAVDALFVDAPKSVSLRNRDERQLRGLNRLRTGENPEGGRIVPDAAFQFMEDGKSVNRHNFDALVSGGMLDKWAVIDNQDYTNPKIVSAGSGQTLHADPEAALAEQANMPGFYEVIGA